MKFPKVSILDYGMGNIWSVSNALKYIGAESRFIKSPEDIISSECLILPGVGSFPEAMKIIKNNFFDEAIIELSKSGVSILGICLGMQILGASSNENNFTLGLNLLPNKVEKFSNNKLKIPHVGFNSIKKYGNSKLLINFHSDIYFYFVHSFRMVKNNSLYNYSICNYDEEFIASVEINNIFGTQFHPEKSQTNGLKLLKNFLNI